jgi:hypothetical protein
MSYRVIEDQNNWLTLEVTVDTGGTAVPFVDSSIAMQKMLVGAHVSNTTNIAIAPTSLLVVESGVGIILDAPSNDSTPDYFLDAPLSQKGNEDLKDWYMDCSVSGERAIVIVRRDP